jgi:dynein heavy chain
MGKFFKGLATSGAWVCFDEFNRIDVEVLSVVAQQIMTVWSAVREQLEVFIFEESSIRLDRTCSVFITMNPGYAGRTELPDNLKSLFRPVAMMVPDYAMIAQILLYSLGFNSAESLSRKVVATFRLASEQLSVQDHYDYGMRAVKTVITRAGNLKREDSKMNEDVLLLRALRDVNVPKFLKQDLPLFEGIISDLFPKVDKPDIDYGTLMNSIIVTTKEQGLQPVDPFLEKCVQLYETTVVRHGLMLVGPTGGGKTSCIHTLRRSLTRLWQAGYDKVRDFTINPKSVTMGQLYGEIDTQTHEWSEGILSKIVRDCIDGATEQSGDEVDEKKKKDNVPQTPVPTSVNGRPAIANERKWIIFDGPVDALWIENMNSVLDDNKLLCLVNSEVLRLTPQMTMIFEVEDLAVASPATVSRCGMVYMEPTALGIQPLTRSWIDKLHPIFAPVRKPLTYYFDTLLEPCIAFVRKQCAEPVPSVDNNLARSCQQLLEAMMAPYIPIDGVPEKEGAAEALANFNAHIEPLFLLSLIWSVGATTDKSGRTRFSTFLRQTLGDFEMKEVPPDRGLVYDYSYDLRERRWVSWMDTAPPFTVDPRLTYNEIIVPTMDSVRYTYLLDLLVKQQRHVLFTGNTGTGKSVNVARFLASLPDNLIPVTLIFSAATSANQTEELLNRKLQKQRKNVYGPPVGKKFVVFVDDMNMPAREKYFAQPPIELLRQWMDHKGWYNRKTITFNEVVDISFVGAMGPPGGGRNPVTPRFLRHFMQIAHTDLDTQSLVLIFSTIVKATLAKFTPEVQNLQRELVNSTIDLFQTISAQLRPTPDKSHYTFNLRDLSAVFQGLLSASYRRLKTVPGLLRLWVHENRRVFYDRLIDDEDRAWLDGLTGAMMKKHFRTEWDEVMPPNNGLLLFGDYMEGMGAEQRVYDEVKDMTMARKVMEDALVEYNEENTPMKLVMFTDAIEHVSRISRILRQPGGNALLLGVGGSGRQSLTRLAAFMVEYELFQIEITKHYGVNEWHEDLKRLLLDAGLKEQPTVFLFSDTQIVKEQFFEDVNNILNSGEVPNLYSNEDLDNIFATCKIDCQRKNIPATKLNAYAQFINRVRAHLHVVLCMSPVGKAFRTRLRMFPALVNCCTIDWFSDWPNEALRSVAQTALNEAEVKLDKSDAVVAMFGAIHQSVGDRSKEYREELRRYNYVTPTSYLELINVFNFLLQEKRGEIDSMKNKLQLGLNTLHAAASEVAGLQQELNDSQPRLEETAREVEKLMEQMVVDKKEATERQEVVEKQAAEAAAKAADCKSIADEAQLELDKALPDLDRAVESLKELNKRHIEEVRDFKKPPSGVVLTMEAACIMLRHKLKFRIVQKQDVNSNKKVPLYWETAQRYLLRHPRTLLDSLKKYERDSIPEKVIKKIKPYVSREDFSVKKIEIASKACRAICMWVHAMYNYYHINENVKPKRARLATAQAELDRMNAGMEETKKALQAGLDRLEFLQQKHQKLLLERERLEMAVRNCTIKLKRANRLLEGLGGEQHRWSSTIASLSDGYESIVGDVLVSSGTIAYLGAFTSAYRTRMTSDWRAKLKELGLPHTDGCSIRTTLADPVQIRAWCLAGLPTDSVSTENGIIMSKARRWPLMIDPQGQASKFIKKLGSEKFEQGMAIAMLSDPRFLQTTEIAIKNGQWLLLENLGEELDPALEPLLQQQIVSIRGHPHIRLGENVIEYDDKFHLYMTTKLANPHYAPELQVKVTLLNFTTTPEGLQDQMLGIVVSAEAFSLEQEKNQRVIDNAKLKNKLQELEDHILKLISENKGHNILEQEELIETLASSKITSSDVARELASAEVTEQRIDEQRRAYAPVAQRASILYFCISDLGVIDPMYQYSLAWFVRLFEHAIKTAPASTEQKIRLPSLIDHFTKLLYENVCRSLFEAHKMLFSFLLTVKIEQGADRIRGPEWRYLVAGAPPLKKTANPSPDWLTENVWNGILALSDLDTFTGFDTSFINDLKHYRGVWDSSEPHKQALPEPWESKLDQFQKLLILKCLRPDKMSSALADYVTRRLGREFVDFPQFNLAQSFRDSTATTPLIFILSRGADPASKLMQFAQEMNFRDKLVPISLGQGQGEVAERQVAEAMRRGTWVLLQNCHLAVSWLPQLERICDDMKPENVHEDFRLWLTSMPTKKFPVSILQSGIKMTNEPPKGLRQNLMRSYLGFTDGQMTKCKKPQVFKKLLFALCFFHAVVLDRRKFGPLGWNIMYDFSENDLSVSVTQLREFLDMYEASADVPYKVIHFLTYDIHYGGRVTDDLDRRTICTILDDFINPSVLNDDYKFSSSGRYVSIPTGTREYYLKYIASMDAFPEPEVFGMHDNADITSAQEETATMFSTILGLLPRASDDKTKKRETLIGEAAAAILKRTPGTWEIENVSKQYPTTYSESMNTVLVQEAIRYNRLLSLMRSSLRDLMRALRGEMVMTEELEQMADSLFNNQVPDLWNTVAYPSLMPLAAWVNDLNARYVPLPTVSICSIPLFLFLTCVLLSC